ncbi:MAG TPA: M48 family metalloprotease [Burkholderiaceae bacterium]|nr:M48 family metalloprotease [Burkholderiaceae bacterium]
MPFDPQAATAAYIDSLGADTLAKAAAYTNGSHWLILWNLVVTVVVSVVIIRSGLLERVERWLGRRGASMRVMAVSVVYFIAAALLSLPWSIYAGWWRERSYGRSSQPFADAFMQELLSTVIFSVLAGLFFIGVYALIRRAGRRWWLWSGALAFVGISAGLLIAPVAIQPLFNQYKPVPEGSVREALATMARDSGIAPDRIFVFDGSRQSNNFTANVSGVGPTARIAISDVALKGASLDEVRAVTAHEIGHYVRHDVWRQVALLSALALAAFFVVDRTYGRVAAALGSRAPLASPCSLPVVVVMVSVLSLVTVPLVNAFVRSGETEADRYSLQTVNLPDALSAALVKTAEYRYPRPTELQEWLFYSHPSVERRVRMAMDWKATHDAAPQK